MRSAEGLRERLGADVDGAAISPLHAGGALGTIGSSGDISGRTDGWERYAPAHDRSPGEVAWDVVERRLVPDDDGWRFDAGRGRGSAP